MTSLDDLRELLEGWLDYFPWPQTWTGNVVSRNTTPGQAPWYRVCCPICEGSGKTRRGWSCVPCKGSGRYYVDAYTEERVDDADTSWRVLLDRHVNCSSCGGTGRRSASSAPAKDAARCDRCSGTGTEQALLGGRIRHDENAAGKRERQGDRDLDALDDTAERRDRQPAYVALETAMDALHGTRPSWWAPIVWCLVLGQTRVEALPHRQRRQLVFGLLELQRLLPDLELPRELAAARQSRRARLASTEDAAAGGVKGRWGSDPTWRRRRDDEIRGLYATGGWSQSALARRYALDRSAVCRIVGQAAKQAA